MPGVIFSGEHLHEVTFFRESFAQRWKLPAVSTLHPVSAFLFSPYTVPYGYLGLPNPDRVPQLYQEYLDSYEKWGVLPTLRVWSVEDLQPDRTGTQKLISIARAWQQFDLKPDFETDWGPETLFRYVGQDGEIATLSTTDGGTILHLPQEDTGYQRVFGVTQVRTDRSLPHWHAYNETTLLGLDPEKSYFLSDTPRDFSQLHINALPAGVSVTKSRVTANAALFRLEKINDSHEIDLLSQLHLLHLRSGIVVNGQELPQQKGATFRRTGISLSGIHKTTIWASPPYQGISGDAFGEWELSLPESPKIHLEFDIGLAEGSENSDGVTFIVSVQGNEIFRQHYNQQRWKHISLNLTPYQGQQVTLRFTTNPGPNANTSWDWANWGEPKIIAEPPDVLTKVGFFLPNEPIKSFPDTLRHTGQGKYVLETELPTHVLLLFQPGQQVVPPYNLRDAEFVAGLQSDDIFRLGSVWGSGQPTIITIGGVQKRSIFAPPPEGGQTVLQFLLSLPQAEKMMFSFSIGLQDGCSDGVLFKVLVNGETQFEHFTDTPGWTDAHISLSEFVGETLLLELVTDPHEKDDCDWAHWGNLLITAEDARIEAPNRTAETHQSVRETKLLSNYPNPFNPETWIPYQLAEAADVRVKIYDASGRLVRTIAVGFKPVGYYLTRERAVYWDGRNASGEPVASGVYFYTLSTESTRDSVTAGEFTATRRMLIRK
ncbi:hypothetical protein C6503_03460 [Candidatus Poribacteria bacterium]|nr:MAG: hypothetical protein C6503_03460 [Candidatus Poribacteria bacterium]